MPSPETSSFLCYRLYLSSGRGWLSVGGRASLGHPQRPLNRFEVHLLYIRIFPGLFGVPQRGVENPPFTVHLAPRHGEIMVGAMDAWLVLLMQFARIQAEQHVYLVARPTLGLIDLVVFDESLGQMADSR